MMIFLILGLSSLVLLLLLMFIGSYYSRLKNQRNLDELIDYKIKNDAELESLEKLEQNVHSWKLNKNLETLKYLNKLETGYSNFELPEKTFKDYKKAKYDLQQNTIDYCRELKDKS